MTRCVWTEYETEFFIKFVKDRRITGILDSKPQINATIKDLNAEMSEKHPETPHMCRSQV